MLKTIDPFDFIRLVRDTKYVTTNFFYVSVFSIQFKKIIQKQNQPNQELIMVLIRCIHLFEITNLQEQLAYYEIDSEIKYNPVDKITDELKIDSLKFLKNCLTISKQYLTNN